MSVLCPRCGENEFVPYGESGPGDRPALSRVDNATYICTTCGQDEAMRDFAGDPPIPPDQWPTGGLRSKLDSLRLSDISADPDLWGPRADEVIPWLQEHYVEGVMPQLQVVTIKGGDPDDFRLLGWKHEGTPFEPLLPLIFGEAYAETQLARIRKERERDTLNRIMPKDWSDLLDGSHRGFPDSAA